MIICTIFRYGPLIIKTRFRRKSSLNIYLLINSTLNFNINFNKIHCIVMCYSSSTSNRCTNYFIIRLQDYLCNIPVLKFITKNSHTRWNMHRLHETCLRVNLFPHFGFSCDANTLKYVFQNVESPFSSNVIVNTNKRYVFPIRRYWKSDCRNYLRVLDSTFYYLVE